MESNINKQLDKFFIKASSFYTRSAWIADEKMKVFVRKSIRPIPGHKKLMTTFDIATVEVTLNYQRQGLFKKFLEYSHAVNPWEVTFVENALAPFLPVFLMRHGWRESSQPSCYFKSLNQKASTGSVSFQAFSTT